LARRCRRSSGDRRRGVAVTPSSRRPGNARLTNRPALSNDTAIVREMGVPTPTVSATDMRPPYFLDEPYENRAGAMMHACGDRPPPSQPPSRRSFISATVRPLTLNPDRASAVWLVAHAVSYRTNTVGYGGRSCHRNTDRLAAALSDHVATIGLTMVAIANDPATVTQTVCARRSLRRTAGRDRGEWGCRRALAGFSCEWHAKHICK
jgi:hypothetical protein